MDMRRTAATEIVVRNGKVLREAEGFVDADVVVEGGHIVEIQDNAHYAGAREIDAAGCLVLPGLIDIHGDAFERNIMPRSGTMFPLAMAMIESDRQLAANGVTTAYHGVTISWEPGLRSVEQSLKVAAALDEAEGQFNIDNRLHVRWENYAIDQLPSVLALMGRSRKPLLAFNDHTSSGIAGTRNPSKYRSSAEKAMITVDVYLALLQKMAERTDEVAFATEVAAAHAANMGVTMLSHDDASAEMRSDYRRLGVRIAEFPLNWETAEAARASDDFIVLGAPNVVRGGSHNGAISAEEAIRRGLCDILASDYYYPSLLQAVLALVESGTCAWHQAMALVSSQPAKALGLEDRGHLAPGKRADLFMLPVGRSRPALVMSQGRVVYREF